MVAAATKKTNEIYLDITLQSLFTLEKMDVYCVYVTDSGAVTIEQRYERENTLETFFESLKTWDLLIPCP